MGPVNPGFPGSAPSDFYKENWQAGSFRFPRIRITKVPRFKIICFQVVGNVLAPVTRVEQGDRVRGFIPLDGIPRRKKHVQSRKIVSNLQARFFSTVAFDNEGFYVSAPFLRHLRTDPGGS